MLAGALDAGATEQFQLAEVHLWILQFGVSYAVGVDGIALSLNVMAAILTPVCLLAAWNDVTDEGRAREKKYYALMLVLLAFMVGVFAARRVPVLRLLRGDAHPAHGDVRWPAGSTPP